MVNFGPLAAEISLGVWDTPANFKEFRILAALLHNTSSGHHPNCGVEHWTPPISGRVAIMSGIGPHF